MILKQLHLLKKDPYIITLLIITIIGIFLRFYKLDAFVTFLGDQGRDAIIMKRIVTLEHLPAVGAPSSIGHVFLGPFYYYFIAPWLLLTGLNPIGPAIGVAAFSSLLIVLSYLITQDLFKQHMVSLMMATLISFSYIQIWFSRFSWNPNLLPLFSLLAVYSLIQGLEKKRTGCFFLSGLLFAFSIQLHYVALASGLAVLLCLGYYGYIHRDQIGLVCRHICALMGGFLIGISPLIAFDIRHDFINVKSFIRLFTDNDVSASSRGLMEIVQTFVSFNTHALQISVPFSIHVCILAILIIGSSYLARKKNIITRYVLLFFWLTLIITSFFTANKHQHYFGFLYPLYYLLWALCIDMVTGKDKRWLAIFIMILFTLIQIPHYSFFKGTGSYQIKRASLIAAEIQKHVTSTSYYLTSLPESVGDSTERYFLEVWGKRSLEKYTTEKADELFVICEEKCTPIGDGQWDIAHFAPRKLVGTWHVDNVTIYKLTR